ncbi:SWIM zinc finger family protein [Limnovirga soli]|uniref:SWIM zinc finger family protein n=1 Tax=Limnovirga soli TaxID=2656915 RepID=A0A8J8FBP6_9BACT|nr:SWIM zinc finger family protein [Limnovirga soli]NNV55063.1 SWIM zinc finger family protein [Limnovirga soli]
MQFSDEQILALAPDESSKKSGKDLANPAKWISKGANEMALWGECQGSGSKPYQTQIDIVNLAFKCSCPSRKFPCKHGIGLLLLYSRQAKDFSISEGPAWVSEWINKRAEKEENKTDKKDKPVDEAAQAKRQKAREQKVDDGLDELLLWIKDIIRNGIINIPEKTAAYYENVARRMVDAQAPGLAGMVRVLEDINFYKEGWQTLFLDQIVKIYLVIQGYKNTGSLNETLQNDIRSLIGFTQNQDELKVKQGIRDDWFVLGKQVSQEEQLTVERNWLFGIHTNQYALVLQFYVRNQVPSVTLTPGLVTDAELVFYSSSFPIRALVKQQFSTKNLLPVKAFQNWEEVVAKETANNSFYPFAEAYPFVIQQLKPVHFNNQWWLQDADQKMMAVAENYQGIWKLLSISGGEALPVAVLGKENKYTPLGAWYNHEYKIF